MHDSDLPPQVLTGTSTYYSCYSTRINSAPNNATAQYCCREEVDPGCTLQTSLSAC